MSTNTHSATDGVTNDEKDLTSIDGVGPTTAEQLEQEGFNSVKDVAIGYLTDKGETVEDFGRIKDPLSLVHETNVLDNHISAESHDPESNKLVRAMSFVRTVGVDSVSVNGAPMIGRYAASQPDTPNVEPEHLDTSKDVIGRMNALMLLWDHTYPEDMVGELNSNPNVVVEKDNGLTHFVGPFSRHKIKTEYVEQVNSIFGFDVTNVRDNIKINDTDSDHPVQFCDPDSGVSIVVAPTMK